jgi:ribonuclease HI
MIWYADGAGWDGSCSRYAVVRQDAKSYPTVKVEFEKFTNNEMEYKAAIHAAQNATTGDTIRLDSELVCNQANGNYKVKKGNLKPLHETLKRLTLEKSLKIEWVPRNHNKAGKALERTK